MPGQEQQQQQQINGDQQKQPGDVQAPGGVRGEGEGDTKQNFFNDLKKKRMDEIHSGKPIKKKIW